MPSRAELSDAAMSERAECVMLNKGEFVLEEVKLLDQLLAQTQAHQHKKTPKAAGASLVGVSHDGSRWPALAW